VGTKYAVTICEPLNFLNDFAETDQLSADVVKKKTEGYLVRVWAGAKINPDAKTFDELRFKVYTIASFAKLLVTLPTTSTVIEGHIKRAFYVVRNVLRLLEHDIPSDDPTDFGWSLNKEEGVLLPDKCLKCLPDHKLKICKCQAECERNCPFKKTILNRVVFCHKKRESIVRTDISKKLILVTFFITFGLPHLYMFEVYI
jgi:hypothetical protein